MIKNKLILMLSAIVVAFSISTKVLASNDTKRIWGSDRYATAVEISKSGWTDGSEYAILANGENFPDAMSIAPIAAEKSMPIILTPMGNLPNSVSEYIKNKEITKTYVVGGNDVVSDNVFNSVSNAERLYGDSRYDTNIAVINRFAKDLDFNKIYLVSGENFPDALAGSALAAKNLSCVIMAGENSGQTTEDFISSKAASILQTTILGGKGVLSDERAANILRIYGNTLGNIKNGGSVAVQGDWLYYSFGPSYIEGKSDNIYAYKKDGSLKIKLSNNFGKYINVVGDWIYYSRYSGGNGIYKVRIDGTDETKLDSDHYCSFLTVIGDKIYYVSDYDATTLFRMNVDGSNKVALGEYIYSANVSGNYIYYKDTAELNTLYKMNLDGTGKTKVSDESVEDYIVDGEWIYFRANDHKLYKMKTDGSEKTSIGNVDTYDYNISNGWVYYVSTQDKHLYKIKADGSGNIKLSDDNASEVSVDGEWIYYYTSEPGSYFVSSFYRMSLDGSQKELIE